MVKIDGDRTKAARANKREPTEDDKRTVHTRHTSAPARRASELLSYEHRLAFDQDDPIRHTLLLLMTTIITAVLRAFTCCVTTAAAVSIILVFEIK